MKIECQTLECSLRPLAPTAENRRRESNAATEHAGNGTLGLNRMYRGLYCLRHRSPHKVFPVTVVNSIP